MKLLKLFKMAYYGVRWSIVLPRVYTNVLKHGISYWVDGQEIKGREKWKKIKSRINNFVNSSIIIQH